MLTLEIPAMSLFDESTQEFIETDRVVLKLEHSLAAISKWEAKWKKPFLSKAGMTEEETVDYIRCMSLSKDVPQEIYKCLPNSVLLSVREYIEDPMTASWISEKGPKKRNTQTVTSELIYYWMIANNIPMKCETWHLNRLIMLIRICGAENQPKKKTNKKDMIAERKALNASRKAQANTKG
jgi:hypothetical protein